MNCPKCNNKSEILALKYRTITKCDFCDYFSIKSIEECCTQSDYQFRKFKNSDGIFTLRKQCANCGFRDSKVYPGKEVANFEVLKPFDVDLEKNRERDFSDEYEYAISLQKQNFFIAYDKYLNYKEWNDKRNIVLKRDNYICQSCKKNKATQVHHLTYDHWMNEPLFDLTSVCNECHEIITEFDRLKKSHKSIESVKKIKHIIRD